jgi:phage-related protein
MLSIYTTENWNIANSYFKDDAVRYTDGLIYYAIKDVPANTPFSATYFGGILIVGNEIRPEFLWQPAYNSNANHNPRVKVNQFGDGYDQRVPDGINNILLDVDYTFDFRSLQEASAILHFLENRGGTELFFFTPTPPYSVRKRMICRQWTHSEEFADNHTVRAKFEERPA